MSYQQGDPSMHYMPPQPAKASGAAITSLVCGLLLCIPFITQLIAIIAGFIGLKASKQPGVGGRGFATAGLVLGFLGLIGWGIGSIAMVGGVTYIYKASAPMVADCRTFTTDLANGKVEDALKHCDQKVISKEDLDTLSTTLQQWGPLNDLSLPVRKKELIGGQWYWSFSGSAKFNDGVSRTAEFEMRQQTDGSFKINSVEYK